MKRLLCLFLMAVILTLSLCSCDVEDADPSTTTTTTTASTTTTTTTTTKQAPQLPSAPTGYKYYWDSHIAFAYPKSWVITEDGNDCVLSSVSDSGTNLRVQYSDLTNEFENVSAYMFKLLMKETFAGTGITVGKVERYDQTNLNGVYAIRYEMELTAGSIKMLETIYMVNSGNRTYSLIFTEVGSDIGFFSDVLWDTLIKLQ